MKFFSLTEVARLAVLTLALVCVPLSAPVLAQSNNSGGTNSSSTTTTQTTRTSEPTSTTQVTRTVTRAVDPVWIALGAVALLAILAIAFLAMRGRGRDRVATTVHERETIIKD